MRITKVRDNKIETIYDPTSVIYEPELKKITASNGAETLTAEYMSEKEAERFFKDASFALKNGLEAAGI